MSLNSQLRGRVIAIDFRFEFFMKQIIKIWISQIADGMDYLGQNNCIHRNLCAENVLVGDHMTIKISGFESAVKVENKIEYYDGIVCMYVCI